MKKILHLLLTGIAVVVCSCSRAKTDPKYIAVAELFTTNEWPSHDDIKRQEYSRFLSNEIHTLELELLMSNALSALNWGANELNNIEIHVSQKDQSQVLTINVRSDAPNKAAKYARALTDAYIEYRYNEKIVFPGGEPFYARLIEEPIEYYR